MPSALRLLILVEQDHRVLRFCALVIYHVSALLPGDRQESDELLARRQLSLASCCLPEYRWKIESERRSRFEGSGISGELEQHRYPEFHLSALTRCILNPRCTFGPDTSTSSLVDPSQSHTRWHIQNSSLTSAKICVLCRRATDETSK